MAKEPPQNTLSLNRDKFFFEPINSKNKNTPTFRQIDDYFLPKIRAEDVPLLPSEVTSLLGCNFSTINFPEDLEKTPLNNFLRIEEGELVVRCFAYNATILSALIEKAFKSSDQATLDACEGLIARLMIAFPQLVLMSSQDDGIIKTPIERIKSKSARINQGDAVKLANFKRMEKTLQSAYAEFNFFDLFKDFWNQSLDAQNYSSLESKLNDDALELIDQEGKTILQSALSQLSSEDIKPAQLIYLIHQKEELLHYEGDFVAPIKLLENPGAYFPRTQTLINNTILIEGEILPFVTFLKHHEFRSKAHDAFWEATQVHEIVEHIIAHPEMLHKLDRTGKTILQYVLWLTEEDKSQGQVCTPQILALIKAAPYLLHLTMSTEHETPLATFARLEKQIAQYEQDGTTLPNHFIILKSNILPSIQEHKPHNIIASISSELAQASYNTLFNHIGASSGREIRYVEGLKKALQMAFWDVFAAQKDSKTSLIFLDILQHKSFSEVFLKAIQDNSEPSSAFGWMLAGRRSLHGIDDEHFIEQLAGSLKKEAYTILQDQVAKEIHEHATSQDFLLVNACGLPLTMKHGDNVAFFHNEEDLLIKTEEELQNDITDTQNADLPHDELMTVTGAIAAQDHTPLNTPEV